MSGSEFFGEDDRVLEDKCSDAIRRKFDSIAASAGTSDEGLRGGEKVGNEGGGVIESCACLSGEIIIKVCVIKVGSVIAKGYGTQSVLLRFFIEFA